MQNRFGLAAAVCVALGVTASLAWPVRVGAQTSGGGTDWARCTQIQVPTERLACYDAWAARMSATAAARPPAAAATPAPAAAQAQAQAQFGLEDRLQAAGPAQMESRIPGAFEGWMPGERIKLANGQVWQIADDSAGVVYGKDLRIKIRRGALGAFYLEVEGTNRSPRVRRVE